jgi:hypothetical protein
MQYQHAFRWAAHLYGLIARPAKTIARSTCQTASVQTRSIISKDITVVISRGITLIIAAVIIYWGGMYRGISYWVNAVTTKEHPRPSVIGATVPTAAGIWAIAIGIIQVGIVAIPDCPMPRGNTQISRSSRVDRDRH